MMQLLEEDRKSAILSPISLPCRKGIATINLTRGCAHGCLYCYARGYRNAPRDGRVYLYRNLVEKLKVELHHRRGRSRYVQFSTASDPFQPFTEVQDTAFEAMTTLLERGIGVSFLTKGFIPERFYSLFASYPGRVYAQIGMVSPSATYQESFEPGAAPPEKRMENIERLKEIGVPVEVRVDPVIPSVTDSEKEIDGLFSTLKDLGIREVSVSFLLLRPAILRQLHVGLDARTFDRLLHPFSGSFVTRVAASANTRLLPRGLRQSRYGEIRALARSYGISSCLCSCKNPDLSEERCQRGVEHYFTPYSALFP